MPATWVGRSLSRDDAAKYKDLQHFILFGFKVVKQADSSARKSKE
jgi:hypothetical protein